MIVIMSNPLFHILRKFSHDRHHYDPGALVFAQGDAVQALYLVERGSVHLIRHLRDGFALTQHRAGAGAILAEASLFSQTYHCDAIARDAATVLCLSKAKLLAGMAKDAGLMTAWATYLAREVQAARLKAEILALRTVSGRLDAWLALNGGALPPKGDWKGIATQIGVSAEALYRELAQRRKRAR